MDSSPKNELKFTCMTTSVEHKRHFEETVFVHAEKNIGVQQNLGQFSCPICWLVV